MAKDEEAPGTSHRATLWLVKLSTPRSDKVPLPTVNALFVYDRRRTPSTGISSSTGI